MSRAVRARADGREPIRSDLPGASSGEGLRTAVPAADYWVSAAAVRQAIGAWAYTLGAGARRPESEAVRAAVAVACAIRELTLDPDRRRWAAAAAPVTEELAALADRAGLSDRDAALALDLLAEARVVVRQTGATVATVALSDAVLAPLPTVAQIDWVGVRHRIQVARASVAPALAVLRELAALVGAFDLTDGTPVVRASVRDLEDATAFGRSTVSESLAALERASLIDVETRAGRTTRFTLRPATFGLGGDAPAPTPVAVRVAEAPGVRRTETTPSHPVAPRPSSDVPTHAPVAAGAPALVGTFAGTPIYAPAGTPLVVAVDEQGRWTCRVGPLLVLGPIAPSES